ncbi:MULTISPECIES: class I adenylate-forming enzyme family protein [unclassified Pseudofrankia]|uniref:class I adenylate-forming enzyme family protein n=1 Tax=unclassified Pseudofrankia TaxID=2994372 RepID=UPI0008D8D768|nr:MULTISPECIES: class I adenylate-forming enzyme family protein [unclassified Pseudofrankia]MDT3445614.1 class I adenylate-forming enzyme family protein [Pseudofrankia sp. BMG5.37]OHV63537.1 AMP-dependent synthetase [Pseudofrankia sp. BMG5.36]
MTTADARKRAVTELARLWGSSVVAAEYAGHVGLVFEPRPRSLRDVLVGADRWAQRTYLVQGERRISFGEFVAALPRAGEIITGRGVQPGDHVLLLGYNSPDWVLALWACWQAGATPVLGNRWWSEAELANSLELTRPALVITDLPDPAPCGMSGALAIADFAAAYEAGSVGDADAVMDGFATREEDDPALVIFTSGSSGAPKGVVLSQRAVIANQHNLLMRSRRLPAGLDPNGQQSVTLVCTPLFHVGGVTNVLTNLIVGGKMVLNEGKFDPAQILRLIETEKVQSFGGVPTMAIRVLEHPSFEEHDLSSLRSWPLGGAPVSPALLERLARQLPQLKRRGLGNTWGMSESGGFVTGAGNKDLEQRPGTVGRPYPVAELRILDPDGTGSGEVLVRSPTVMLGYLGLDDETVDSEGWLHTGDLGHLDEDNYLYLDGRSKDVVIRGGENVATGHVEMAIARHPEVLEVAVFGIPHADLGEEVAAVVVAKERVTVTPEDLTTFLRGAVAYFAFPTRWSIRTDRLPTLAGEKIDKKTVKAEFLATEAATGPEPERGTDEKGQRV